MVLGKPLHLTQQIAAQLEELGVRYFVGGSLASSLYGIPRATQDVDIIADIKREHIPKLMAAFCTEFYIDADMIRDALRYQSSFNIIHLGTMFKVDIFILKADKVSQNEMARRQKYKLSESPEQILYLASVEDIIAHKLLWYQMGGGVSERQWNDVLGVIKIQFNMLDHEYLKTAAEAKKVTELLEKALQAVTAKGAPSKSNL